MGLITSSQNQTQDHHDHEKKPLSSNPKPPDQTLRKNKRSTRSLRDTPEPDAKAFSSAASFNNNGQQQIDLSLAFALLNKQPPESSLQQLGFPSHVEGGVFGTSQYRENAGYAFGNGSSGLEMGETNKVLMGLPWHMNNNGESFGMMNYNIGSGGGNNVDSGRDIWTNNMNYINSGALI
ncbi:unnamed protein product [Cochlearia groenlandica]